MREIGHNLKYFLFCYYGCYTVILVQVAFITLV